MKILYEDSELIVVVKPAGVESQSARRFQTDMVSEIKKHLVINRLSTPGREPYVGVIHRLDKPVSGVMVYAKTKKAAAALSAQVQNGRLQKRYQAVLCGKPVKNVDNLVDYLKKSVDGNVSRVVDKETDGGKRAELSYRIVETRTVSDGMLPDGMLSDGMLPVGMLPAGEGDGLLSLAEIDLHTGRHHQIRVQFASRGLPIYGDFKYNPAFQGRETTSALALCAVRLGFFHPSSGKWMEFSIRPEGGAFEKFYQGE